MSEPTNWFISDTHFGHEAIIKHSSRPFANADEMDDKLEKNWNSVVRPGDTVYHLGDFVMRSRHRTISEYLKRLNGKIILIKGNHDDRPDREYNGFSEVYEGIHEIWLDNKAIILCHYAMRTWNKSHYKSWHLYGHSHGSLPDDPALLSFDVGVDCHNYTPISLEQVSAIMQTKIEKQNEKIEKLIT